MTGCELLRVSGLTVDFGGNRALDDVSFEVVRGQVFGIVGPNGAGKTSLLNCLNAVVVPKAGSVVFEDHELVGRRIHDIVRLGIARTFQGVSLQLDATVAENILSGRDFLMRYGLVAAMVFWGRARSEEARHRSRVEEIIDFLDMGHLRDRLTGDLPWGQQKLVEIGRALAAEPRLLLLDEPTSGMTRGEKEEVAGYIERLQRELGMTQILIEHDVSFVGDLCDNVLALDFGRVIARGSPAQVFNDPQVVAAFLGVAG